MPRVEGELVEVVLDRLDLAVVADLVAEAEEGVLDLPPRLRDRVQVAERERLARQRDVDTSSVSRRSSAARSSLLCGASTRPRAGRGAVQRHAGLAVADCAQRLRELALAAEVAHARVVQLAAVSPPRSRSCASVSQGLAQSTGATVPSRRIPWALTTRSPDLRRLGRAHDRGRRRSTSSSRSGADGPVVELAVGNGRVAIPVARRPGGRVLGIDSSPAMLAQARERAAEARRRAGAAARATCASLELEEPAALVYCPFRSLLPPADVGRPAARLRARSRPRCGPGGRFAWNAFVFDPHIAARDDGIAARDAGRHLGRRRPRPGGQPDRHHASRIRRPRSRSGG